MTELRGIALLILALGASATAQEESPPPLVGPALEDIPIPSDQDGRETLELTLADALRLGRANNVALKAQALRPFQLAEELRIEEALFEPELFGAVDVGRSVSPSRNVFQPSIERESLSGTLGFRQRLVTGGLYELSFSPARLRQSAGVQGFPERQYTASFTATVVQPLLRDAWTNSGLAAVEIAEASLTAGRARFARAAQDTLLQVVEAYWELAFARMNYRVVFQALELAREQLRITNERIRVRELAERERVSDEAEVARRLEELIRAENEVRTREDVLRELLFDDSDGALWERNLRPISPIEGEFELPDVEWQDAARVALEMRPDLAALRADVRSAEIARDEAHQDVLPQLDFVASYGTTGVTGDFHDSWDDASGFEFPDWSLGLQFVVPFGNNAARAARDRADLVLEESRRTLYAAELTVTREVREQLRTLRTLATSIEAAREAVRLAEVVLDTERERLKVGRGTLFEVQQRNQELLDARQRLLRNQLDYRAAQSRLRHAQGLLFAPGEGRSGL